MAAAGADTPTYAQALIRIGREGTGVRTFFSGHTSIGQYPILRFGTPEQKQAYLPASTRGERIMAFGLTEPEAGSNPLEMTSTYRRDGDRYLLNGVKYLISNGGIADTVIVFAYPADRTGPKRRISAFIVDTAGDTFQREDLPAKLGMPTTNTGMFEMTDHPVPLVNMLGREGEGFRIAMATLISGRLSVAAGCLGVIEDCLAEVLEYCHTRHQHGKPIGRHQLVQEHVAAIELARNASRLMIEQAAAGEASGRGKAGRCRASCGCRYASRTSEIVCDQRRVGRRGPGRASVRRPRLVESLPSRPAFARRSRLPDLRRNRRDPETENRGGAAREGFRGVWVNFGWFTTRETASEPPRRAAQERDCGFARPAH